jgi:hypothetical protein
VPFAVDFLSILGESKLPSRFTPAPWSEPVAFIHRTSAVAVLGRLFLKILSPQQPTTTTSLLPYPSVPGPSIYQAPPRRLNALRFRFSAPPLARVASSSPGPGRPARASGNPADGGGAGGAVPRRRVVVRGRLALPSPRPQVS